MSVRIACDNPTCETSLELEPGQDSEFVPAGWWEIGRAAEVGGHEASYVVCCLDCLAALAVIFADPPAPRGEPA